ncbi:MAG TPA: hypothetical protein VGV39_13790 [Mesorhizobium sp.]|jgi:hypothetical protein|uniref:hypothetical protein n=1 Tax=Mesorhizobium sp. TaxID=1871066 RepID=UPI002DDD0859|nr:hypothetical protein [Mesorhizobium sp.]HEV2504145.1 hypothetical protein [Mesorhizobium sp.]
MSKLKPAILSVFSILSASSANADDIVCKQLPFQQEGILDRSTMTIPPFGAWGSWMKAPVDRAGTLRVSLRPDLDPNHIDGFGALQLVAYVYLDGQIDLRDAKLKFDIQGHDFVANDANLFAWVQSCRFGEQWGSAAASCANWAFSSAPLTNLVESGTVESVELKLADEESKWSYAGSNAAIGSAAAIYRYRPLPEVLANPINLHFVLAIPVGGMPAEGDIRLSNVSICPSREKKESFMPKVVSARRDGYSLSVRANAQGLPSNISIMVGNERIASIYAGSTRHDRDILLRNTKLALCAEADAVIENQNGTHRIPVMRNESLWQKVKRVAWCMTSPRPVATH